MNKPYALETGPLGEHGGGLLYQGHREVRFCIIRRTFFCGGSSKRCVKEGSGNGHLSP